MDIAVISVALRQKEKNALVARTVTSAKGTVAVIQISLMNKSIEFLPPVSTIGAGFLL